MKFFLLQLLIVDGSAHGMSELRSGSVPNSWQNCSSPNKERWSSPWQHHAGQVTLGKPIAQFDNAS